MGWRIQDLYCVHRSWKNQASLGVQRACFVPPTEFLNVEECSLFSGVERVKAGITEREPAAMGFSEMFEELTRMSTEHAAQITQKTRD